MKALSCSLKRLSQETSPKALFPQPPVVRFAPQRQVCLCGGRLFVQKSRRKTVLRMTGPFIAHETVLQCPVCCRIFTSEALLQMVPSRCNVGYDVMVFVGRALFQRHLSTEEVRAELAASNVRLCASEVDYLGRKFIFYLANAHSQATPQIRKAMRLAGGYILHLDATHDGDAPALMSALDSLSKIVLANVKVPTEHAEHLVPFLRKIDHTYGSPLACVHDMGTGICKAVAEVFSGIGDFICHFHFLRDIGKDYLEAAYRELRNCLRTYAISARLRALLRQARHSLIARRSDCALLAKAIKTEQPPKNTLLLPVVSTYSLALWSLQGKKSGDGYGFPFDRPLLEFAKRLLELDRHMPQLLVMFIDESCDMQPLFKLAREVFSVAKDPLLQQAVAQLQWRCQVFDTLRSAMRIAPPGGKSGLNDDGTTQAMSTIREGVEQFRRKLDEDDTLAADPLSRRMAQQIDKYGDKLFADPIEVDSQKGKITIYPQRTNNILEQFFRELRRAHRRKTGNNSMRRALKTMPADTPLVKNLDNPEYMTTLLDGKASLEELFAALGTTSLTGMAESQSDIDRILPGFKEIIKLPTLPEQVRRICPRPQQMAKLDKSN